MKHCVRFENCENNWSNGLPLGNGVFGGMAFFENGVLSLSMCHYEVYYNIAPNVLPQDKLASVQDVPNPGTDWKDIQARAERNQPKPGEPFYTFRGDKGNPSTGYASASFSGSYPVTGELQFTFAEEILGGSSNLQLTVEDARVDFTLEKDGLRLALEIIVARQDCIVLQVRQSRSGLLTGIRLHYPHYRDREYPAVRYSQPDGRTAVYHVTQHLTDAKDNSKDFSFAGALRLKNATCTTAEEAYSLTATVAGGEEWEALFGIFTDWRYSQLPDYDVLDSFEDTQKLRAEHAAYWQEFHSRANISLPDKFLEKLWYVNQYALDCCSGRDGIMKHHACGLNGLWASRQPNLWGSMWYWDVNIQAAFAGVFSSNRLELGKVFSDGLRSYLDLARQFAKNSYNLPGIAIDYPYFNYFSTWPWCAQYLWFQYEYSQDTEYLRQDAYPVFLELCRFTVKLFQWDESRGCYSIYPDTSPEQGPLTHNSIITIASVKYMLRFTLEAARILDDHDPLLADIQQLLDHMPAYPTCDSNTYGPHWKDSEDAPDNLWIRHPSMLMPVFPVGEIDIESDPALRQLVDNTVDFLEDHCEIGVFQCSWLSAVASRMGKGQKALRLLYERGIDHMLRANGLTAECTDRFMNYCLILRQPLYYPCMMEFTGEMLAAVNEMLLQSHNGVIRVFPALPDGDKEYDRLLRHGQSITEYNRRTTEYAPWKDVQFTNMLAKGAFEVSAQCRDGKITWIRLHSRAGCPARITTPGGLDGFRVFCDGAEQHAAYADGIVSFATEAGRTYLLQVNADAVTALPEEIDTGLNQHLTYTKRRIFIGEDAESAYTRTLDGFIRDWYLGNVRMENHTVYKFDCTLDTQKKYGDLYPSQFFGAETMLVGSLPFIPITPTESSEFSRFTGYGFADASQIRYRDAGGPDMLRRDFAESSQSAVFQIEVPRGQYELLVISGSADEESVTHVETDSGFHTGGKRLAKGSFQAELVPVYLPKDGLIRLRLSTDPGYTWKLNAIYVNWIKSGC